MRAIYYKLEILFANRGSKWNSVLELGHLFSENYMKMMKEETIKSNTRLVKRFYRQNFSFSVQKTMDQNEDVQWYITRSNYTKLLKVLSLLFTLLQCHCDTFQYSPGLILASIRRLQRCKLIWYETFVMITRDEY